MRSSGRARAGWIVATSCDTSPSRSPEQLTHLQWRRHPAEMPTPPHPAVGTAGRLIAAERAATGETRDQFAARSGLSTGLLSQLERGLGNPALSSLVRLAQALDVPLSRFFEEPPRRGSVIRAHERPTLRLSDVGVAYELHTPITADKLGVVRVTLPPGWTNAEAPFRHPGEECLTVLEGCVEAHLGTETVELEAGDSVTYDSGVPHWYVNPGPSDAVTLGAMTPPNF